RSGAGGAAAPVARVRPLNMSSDSLTDPPSTERAPAAADVVDPGAEEEISAELAEDEPTQEVVDEIRARAEAQAGVTKDTAFGQVGRPFDRSGPFFVGFVGALGAACAVAIALTIVAAGQVLVLLGLPRWAAVSLVVLAMLVVVGGFVALAVPLVTEQASKLSQQLPGYLHRLDRKSSTFSELNSKFHIVHGLQKALAGGASFESVVGVGKAILGFITSAVLVTVVAIYLLIDLPRVRRSLYLLAPRSRRPRMVLLTDEMLDRVGGYVLGNLLLSLIAAVLTTAWALAFGIPYAVLQGLLVGLLDLIPIIGSTIGGIIVSLVALTVSLPVAIATGGFYVLYRFLEDYLLTPRIMRR